MIVRVKAGAGYRSAQVGNVLIGRQTEDFDLVPELCACRLGCWGWLPDGRQLGDWLELLNRVSILSRIGAAVTNMNALDFFCVPIPSQIGRAHV